MQFSNRIKKINVSTTIKVAQLAIEMKAKGEDIIDLSVGEPDFPTPQNIKDAAVKAINNNFTKYTINSGTIELRRAVAKKLREENNLNFTPNEIIVSNGAKQSIFNAIQVLVDNGDEVIIPAPYYVSYPEMVTLAGGIPKIIETTEENNFKITPQQLRNAINDRTKLLIICSPSNPTGAVYSEKELRDLLEIITKGNFFLLTDDIYEKIIYDNLKFVSAASLNEIVKNKTVVINGLSKSYSMTGWRIGYAAANSEIVQLMNKLQGHSTSNASSISQAAALAALTGSQESVELFRTEFEKRRNFFYEKIISINGISCVKPQGAFYLFPNIKHFIGKKYDSKLISNSVDLAEYLLEEAKTAVVPGIAFGMEGFVRLSFSTSIKNLELGSERIKKALEELS